jgi:hypothetical protein
MKPLIFVRRCCGPSWLTCTHTTLVHTPPGSAFEPNKQTFFSQIIGVWVRGVAICFWVEDHTAKGGG